MTMSNEHIPNWQSKQRVTDMATAGIPVYLIAKVMKIDPDTLVKHYDQELSTAQPEAVTRIGKVVALQAEAGDPKAQALYLKTQGAKYGWAEKQIIETTDSSETKELKDMVAALEAKYSKEY